MKTETSKEKAGQESINGQRICCYDNGGKTFDRYTVVYLNNKESIDCYSCVGMSENPFSPQGFGQHSTAQLGRHLGKRIAFASLPVDCQKLVQQDTRQVA